MCIHKILLAYTRGLLLPCLIFLQLGLFAQQRKFLLPPQINEASGLVAISEDSLLWINDSGNEAVLFLTNIKGDLLETISVDGAKNKDWEDLSYDGQGNVYIGDVGNNCHCRKDLKIYRWNLANRRLDSISFSYDSGLTINSFKEEEIYDLEGFYWTAGKIHLFTKGNLAKKDYDQLHATLNFDEGEQVAEMLSLHTFAYKRVVTGAAIRPDQQEVALLAYKYGKFLGIFPFSKAEVYLFPTTKEAQKMVWTGASHRIKLRPRLWPSQFEAIDYLDHDRIVVGSEKTPVFKAQGRIIHIKRK